jgi:mono/diheme cytochrome c family protein
MQTRMKQTLVWAALLAPVLLSACGDSGKSGPVEPVTAQQLATAQARGFDTARVTRGGELFQQNCASCHGAGAVGAADWNRPGPDGRYPAPPLNGTAHAWHHPGFALARTIREGTAAIGGSMPPWKDKLSEQDIESVIQWFQSFWSDEIYTAWVEMDARPRERVSTR